MNESRFDKMVGWAGATGGITGALLLALNFKYSGYGYIFFLLSSVLLFAWSYKTGAKHNMLMQGVFIVLNAIGTYNWLLR